MDDENIVAAAFAARDKALVEAQRWTMVLDGIFELRPELRNRDLGRPLPSPQLAPPRVFKGLRLPAKSLLATERAALEAIRRAGHGIHTKELLPLLEAAGIEIGGKDPAATLSARLSRSTKLISNRSLGWMEATEAAVAFNGVHVEAPDAPVEEPPYPMFPLENGPKPDGEEW